MEQGWPKKGEETPTAESEEIKFELIKDDNQTGGYSISLEGFRHTWEDAFNKAKEISDEKGVDVAYLHYPMNKVILPSESNLSFEDVDNFIQNSFFKYKELLGDFLGEKESNLKNRVIDLNKLELYKEIFNSNEIKKAYDLLQLKKEKILDVEEEFAEKIKLAEFPSIPKVLERLDSEKPEWINLDEKDILEVGDAVKIDSFDMDKIIDIVKYMQLKIKDSEDSSMTISIIKEAEKAIDEKHSVSQFAIHFILSKYWKYGDEYEKLVN